jgi:hypothetical protein
MQYERDSVCTHCGQYFTYSASYPNGRKKEYCSRCRKREQRKLATERKQRQREREYQKSREMEAAKNAKRKKPPAKVGNVNSGTPPAVVGGGVRGGRSPLPGASRDRADSRGLFGDVTEPMRGNLRRKFGL